MRKSTAEDCLQEEEFSDDTTIVQIWYEMGYGGVEQIREVLRIDPTMLYNSIGGAVGLFLGYSLNSLIATLLDCAYLAVEKLPSILKPESEKITPTS